jgi:exonuclease SbcD
MARLAFLFRTDIHAADKNPDSWKGDYSAEVWSNLEQIGELARKHEVDAVLDGGDYFHVKASTRNSHALVAQTAEVHAEYRCPTWLVPGNHDIAYNNLDTLDQQQPLRVLFATKVFHRLGEETFERDGLKVRVVGMPFKLTRTLDELRAIKKGDEDCLIAVVHALAGEKFFAHVEDFFDEPIFRYADLIYDGGPDVWCFGHWHKDQGVVQLDGRHFVNPGAVSRGALVKENLKRKPQVALIEVTGEGVTVGTIPLKVPPAKDVFNLERKERRDRESEIISGFAERLQEEVLGAPTEDIEGNVEKLVAFDDEVRQVAKDYLERARSES